MKKELNLDLYLVTDRDLSLGRPIDEIVNAAAKGGATLVQLREKKCSTREFVEIANKLLEILRPKEIPLLINDRLDVALAVKADGVHIGQSDMPYEIAREMLGPEAIIGLSVESVEDAIEAEKLDVDYIGLSPIFSTPTKTDTKHELGLEGIKKIKKISGHKLVGIGGMNSSNAERVIAAGADGIAVVSAICSAESPEKASRELREIVVSTKRGLQR
ncbi:MAG: thiamine phosphate synthase [Ignavibacteria bacterium]|jgi:thiamine-phosphate pyrophosphorylase